MNPLQTKTVHVLLNKTGLISRKAALVLSYTNGRSESSKELTVQEANEMIAWLRLQDTLDDAKNKMRRKIISNAYEMGWAAPGDWKTAVDKINTFCIGEKGLYKKDLNSHSHAELVQLVSQFESMYKKHLRRF